ncbi:helix-turn-helix domain-containing protein [Leyella stercorea]|uniref:helix-turn-helix domain-containing protein n=1 Tax=Leyella stercorea TaxID=363265 RepID=UPI00242F84C2|nr:helix-turn-helix transcriptional regulator [Leyella stercorea]
MNIVLDVLRYLKEHDITLVRAAEATGVAQQNIKKSIGNNPKTSTLLALAKGLSVDPRESFYDLDEKAEEGYNVVQHDYETPCSLDASKAAEKKSVQNSDQEDTLNSNLKEEQDNNARDGAQQVITTNFCPHCGARVRVGVVLLPEQ